MNRREALMATAAAVGTAIIGSQAFLSGCARTENRVEDFNADFNADMLALLDEIGETILPASASSPGAREGRIGEFMKVMVTDCYSPSERAKFLEGVFIVQQAAQKKYSSPFVELTAQEKTDLLLTFDQEARTAPKADADAVHFFTMFNQLTVWGFFSSEAGATRALRYVPIPGRYEGCIPYVQGEGAWVY
jgi:hypothetical protein